MTLQMRQLLSCVLQKLFDKNLVPYIGSFRTSIKFAPDKYMPESPNRVLFVFGCEHLQCQPRNGFDTTYTHGYSSGRIQTGFVCDGGGGTMRV